MYGILHGILEDKKGGEIFRCFGMWHFVYIAAALALIIVLYLVFRKRSLQSKEQVTGILADVAFGFYVADLFLMPLAYGEIDIEKLPFHICTAMCVMCFLSRHVGFLKRYKIHFALLGLISNFVYLIYPAGVMWHQVHPLSYRVWQTLLFHGIMTAYGLLTLVFDSEGLSIKKCYRDLIVIVSMTAWALLGNTLYNGSAGEYDHFFNWFFVKQDPFGLFPENVAPFVMPFLNIAVFFAAELAVYGLSAGIKAVLKITNAKARGGQSEMRDAD